jgi:hypothetical protein
MRSFKILADSITKCHFTFPRIFKMFAYSAEYSTKDGLYVFISGKDNNRINKSGFLLIPQIKIIELAAELSDIAMDFDDLLMKILHPVAPEVDPNEKHNIFLSIDEYAECHKKIVPSNFQGFAPFCDIVRIKPQETIASLIAKGYPESAAKAILANPEEPVWAPLTLGANCPYAMSTLKLSARQMYMASNSKILDQFLMSDNNAISYELHIIDELRSFMLIQKDVNSNTYSTYAESWLKTKFKNIPTDAIDRIIGVSKPNIIRKTKWWDTK